jgi:diadenosine tetraphosphate (Ap4A) HIT family hydrolase
MFELDKKLQADTLFIHDFEVSRLLLMNDANYLWLILVPRKSDLAELIDLDFDEQTLVLKEINLVAKILQNEFGAYKLNIANLGNVVRQLHIHVIARFEDDPSFPKPVWGAVLTKHYEEKTAQNLIAKIQSFLKKYVK